jgi:hypothetical protein
MFSDYGQYIASLSLEERRKVQEERDYAIAAARKGCGKCQAPIPWFLSGQPPAGEPFKNGQYKGRFWCSECWVLYWDSHPQDLTDEASRDYVAQEASAIRLRKNSEMLYNDDDGTRVFLTERGTVVLSIALAEGCAPNEFDPGRFALLLKALQALDASQIMGFSLVGTVRADSA